MVVEIVLSIVCLMICIELEMGRTAWPDRIRLWGGTVESSRQVLDWYSPSHVIHGLALYAITGNLLAAVAIEAAWEVLENSPLVINRYRQTSSADYEGDTVLNSVSDLACMAAGFGVAALVPWQASVAIAAAFELLTLLVIRDNLTLNILMLAHPFPKIKAWQMGEEKEVRS